MIGRLLSELDDFDQDFIIGNARNNRQENITVNEGTADWEHTVGKSDNVQAVNENVVFLKTLERCFSKRIDRDLGKIVDTVEDGIQNAILTAVDSVITPKNELAISSKNASSERESTSVMASSERGKRTGITAPLENVSEKKTKKQNTTGEKYGC